MMFKKIWFAILAFSTACSLHAQEYVEMKKAVQEESDYFRYTTFGVIIVAPSIGLGIRSQQGRWGNDFSLSGASVLIVNGLIAQYSRLLYFSKEGKNTGYCGLGPALNYVSFSGIFDPGFLHYVRPSAVVSAGGQFKTKNRTHFIELKGNIIPVDWRKLTFLPSLYYGVSF